MEHKLLGFDSVQLTTSDENTKSFSGYGAVFGNVDWVGDVVEKGAFAKTLATSESLPMMYLNHDVRSLPIGKWTKMEEDDVGLRVEGHFIDTAMGRDAYTASKSGAISGLSIGFRPVDVVKGGRGQPARILKSVDLHEVSVVTVPCNDRARISDVKSLDDLDEHMRELIRLGIGYEEAKQFIASFETHLQAKYDEKATMEVARNLLSKLQGER